MPTFHSPFFYNSNYYNRFSYPQQNCNNNPKFKHKNINSNTQSAPKSKPPDKSPDEPCFFEVFGLKLYFDDVLLIVLIFFLYQEGVKDDELFISLILLLLS